MEIRVSKAELVQYGLWRKTCDFLNLTAAENCDLNEVVRLNKDQAVYLGLIVVPGDGLSDDEEDDEDDGYDDNCSNVRLRFTSDVELEVVSRFNDTHDQVVESEKKLFRCGQEVDVTILSQCHSSYDLLFDEGYGAFGVSKACVQEIE